MSVFKRGHIWWYEFVFNGQRVRESSGSSDRDLALLREAEHRRTVETGEPVNYYGRRPVHIKGAQSFQIAGFQITAATSPSSAAEKMDPAKRPAYTAKAAPLPGMSLKEAGELWLNRQQERYRPRTIEADAHYLKNLVRFFGDIPLLEFHIGHFEHYQAERGKKVCASTVNHELNVLSRILREVDLWHPIKRRYNLLKENEWKPPKIFTADEQERLFKKLKANPKLELADIVFTITRNTTASGCELRGLRLHDVELEADPPRVRIPPDSTKNNVRPRTIPLNAAAVAAFRRALDRAKKLGCHYPENYLFPLRVNRALWDPTKPASRSWLRKQTKDLRELTGIEHIKPHTFRHLAVTELLEKGAAEQTVIALAGWVGRKMINTYSHTRIEAKADVVGLLDGTKAKPQGHPAQPPAQQPPAPTDVMHPAIQAEIARQVALALQQRELPPATPPSDPAAGARLLTLPNAAPRANEGSHDESPQQREAFSLQGWTGNGFYFGSST